MVLAQEVPWFFGTAGYPPGTLVGAPPAGATRVLFVRDDTQDAPAVPPGYGLTGSTCRDGVCLDTLSR